MVNSLREISGRFFEILKCDIFLLMPKNPNNLGLNKICVFQVSPPYDILLE